MPQPDPLPPRLEELAVAAARGEQSASGELLRRLQDTLWRFCRCQLGDAHAADDAVQETAVRLLRGLRGFGGRSSVRTWALGIALNVCREARRRVARAPVSLLAEPTSPSEPVESVLTQADGAAAVRAWVAGLPDRQREAIVLRYFEELSVEQTAQAMGCATGTVKAAVFAGLKTLRKQSKTKPILPT